MVLPVPPPVPVRLSPSGPELGTPPSQIGGPGAVIPGRMWLAQGNGAGLINVPNPAADVSGLDAVPVDLRPGYGYDIDVDAVTTGTNGALNVNLLGSPDGGLTYTSIGTYPVTQFRTGAVRMRLNVGFGNYVDHLKVQLSTTNAASADAAFRPALCALRVREYSF